MKQKIISFNNARLKTNMTFLADNTANDKNNLTCGGVKVLPLYDIKDVSLKKLGLHAQQNFNFHDVDRHHDVYAPQL